MSSACSIPLNASDCFALLDDCDATRAAPRSRLYTGYRATLSCHDASALPALLEEMQQALRQGLHAVGLFAYELGEDLHGIPVRECGQALAEILLFDNCDQLSSEQVSDWLAQRVAADNAPAGIAGISASVDETGFNAAIARIHAYIEAGDTYQINYTYRLHFDAYGAPHALYCRLRARQPVPYGALLVLPDGRAVLSLSPELFVRHTQGTVLARPMKGTAAAGDAQQDSERAATLAADPKNRAENLMIVDLLRNDLGRVARLGSVRVSALFEVKRYSNVLQMTSTIQAEVRTDVTLTQMLTALYPCGSITGAPKRRTMQIIRELESTPRGLYTGAIGWFEAPDEAHPIGDFCLAVPIRTLLLQPPGSNGVRAGAMGVGAGIVHDSVAAEEYAECALKAGFLTGLTNEFELFETMHATQADGCRHLDLHLRRLQSSAAYFGFTYDEQTIRTRLKQACSALGAGEHRMRLALNQNGICSLQSAPLTPWKQPVRLLLSPQPTVAGELFLRHKTTLRERYDAAWRAAEVQGAFDMLFCNTQGELTEGARSNIFLKLDGRWYTPPLECGLLPGVMRAVLLADPAWAVSERRLTMEDLRAAQEVVVCNALRGVLAAVVSF